MSDNLSCQIYRVFIRATPEEIWEAITTPSFTTRYFHGAAIEVRGNRVTSHGPDGSTWGDAEVFEADRPHRLSYGWQSLYDPEMAKEAPSRVTWEIEERDGGVCMLSVTHDPVSYTHLPRRQEGGRRPRRRSPLPRSGRTPGRARGLSLIHI